MAYLSPIISIVTLNVNGLNKLIERNWQTGFKSMIQLYTVYKNSLQIYQCRQVESKKMKKKSSQHY